MVGKFWNDDVNMDWGEISKNFVFRAYDFYGMIFLMKI